VAVARRLTIPSSVETAIRRIAAVARGANCAGHPLIFGE
jgi:hypothetical protein